MSANNGEMPKTHAPAGTIWLLLGTGFAVLALLVLVFDVFLGVAFFLAVSSFTLPYWSRTVNGYKALIVINDRNKEQRVLFQGFNLVLPWERNTRLVELDAEIKEVHKQTYGALDGSMNVAFTYIIRPDISGPDPGRKVILYVLYKDAVKMQGRAIASKALSDYYGKNEVEELLDKDLIEKEVFEKNPGKATVEKFQNGHGVTLEVTLEDSDRDKATQAARDTVSRAKSLAAAADQLKDWDPALAQKTVRQMNLPNVREVIITADIKGLEKLERFTALGGTMGLEEGGDDGHKKGGAKGKKGGH